MLEPKFTKGPWTAVQQSMIEYRIHPEEENAVALVKGKKCCGEHDSKEIKANALLIAAAPELYKEYKGFLEVIEKVFSATLKGDYTGVQQLALHLELSTGGTLANRSKALRMATEDKNL
jgi:hypothetical protein